MKRPNLTELARKAGVSVTTASRALNNHPYVSADVHDKVIRAANEMNYFPRAAAEKKRIGILVNNFEDYALNSYRSQMLSQLSRQCGLRDVGMEIIPVKDIELLQTNFLKVAVVFQSSLAPELLTEAAKQTNIIGINTDLPNVPKLYSDNTQGITLAMKYLLERGHKRIGIILPYLDLSDFNVALRLQAFRKFAVEHGLPDGNEMVGVTSKAAAESIAKLLHTGKPDALIIAGEDMVLQVNYLLHLLGCKVPETLSVISFENKMSSEYMIPPHTTIVQDFESLAEAAIELAVGIIDGKQPRTDYSVAFPFTLIERESVENRNYFTHNTKG